MEKYQSKCDNARKEFEEFFLKKLEGL